MFYMAVETFWDTAGENGTYVPDPDQAETVRLIFQMYSDGEKGLTQIVNELYRLGRLDAGGHVSWDASKVSRVLHNATYKGCICYNKSHSDGYLTQKRIKNPDESSYVYVKGILSRWYQKRCGTDVSRFCCPALHGSSTRTAKSTNICGIRQNLSGQQSCGAAAELDLSSSNGE